MSEELGGQGNALNWILGCLEGHGGNREVLVYLPDGRMVRTDRSHRVEMSHELRNKLAARLGEMNIK